MGSNAAADASDILKGSGLTKWQEGVRAEFVANHDALHEQAARLERGFKQRAKKWALGLDARYLTLKVCRPIRHAADLQMESARAMVVSHTNYLATVGSEKGKAGAGAFDETQ